jgi:DNA primase
MAGIDFDDVRARHPLGAVARRTGLAMPDAGRAMVCCPLPAHDDRQPSMHLDLDRDRYYCFGCGAHGDVIQWICDIEGVRTGEAVAILDARRPIAGVHTGATNSRSYLSRPDLDTPDLERTPPERVRAAMQTAWRYYTFTSLHQRAVDYLTQERQIDVAALEVEQARPVIGHTPSRADGLGRWLRAQGFTDDELVDASLSHRRRDGTIIDFFRDRVLLPVTDEEAHVTGIIGRATTRRAPKYLNQALTHTYDKHLALYRPVTAALDPDANVIVVEGTLDALAIAARAASAGLSAKYAPVSASGVRLSDEQVDAILNLHPKAPVLAADGDQAGRDANLEWAARIALRHRESVVTTWPEGHDPASWLASHHDDGLAAVTRRGCLDASATDLRPRHCGAMLTRGALDQLPNAPAERTRALRRLAAEVANVSRYLGPNASRRYAESAARVLAPVVVRAGIDAATDGRVATVIEHVAVYGADLPPASRTAFARRAAAATQTGGLAAASWTERRLQAALEQRGRPQPTGSDLSGPDIATSNGGDHLRHGMHLT